MNKEQQDKLWNDLPEEYKSCYSVKYKRAKSLLKDNPDNFTAQEVIRAIVPLFGEHNLNPKPKPKTWEDFLKEFHKDTDWNPKNEFADLILYGMDDKVKTKIIATSKIAKLIELGYGGMVTEEEALDDNIEKSAIDLYEGKIHLHTGICTASGDRFLMFRSNEMGEEFMSYESNRKLVEQYYMMNQI